MTLDDRCRAFEQAFPKWPAAWPHVVRESGHDVLYAVWVLGNDYARKVCKCADGTPTTSPCAACGLPTRAYYGSFPPGLLPRVLALFPDVTPSPGSLLHCFSGSLPEGPYARCDMAQPSEYPCSVLDLPAQAAGHRWPLIIADPPYSAADAVRYATPMIDRRKAVAALGQVAPMGGHLAWLDVCWPMHRKAEWLTVGRILVQRSTNHRVRLLTLFERVA